ncbi:GNAT family N-acetyltransferase [Kribbella sp.]|uniref:GNAT family N-acetyltransferase n=1 Tax=Kribbella sp. TaxID=1871183 RepID=UPI002D7017D8|nr:GNAT family N-acetyltransferase [Kribbella sp.]HZX07929.1 GNAT family N-acetyltransferase [Kribbella sp.]
MILLRPAAAVPTPPVPGVVLRPPTVEDTQPLAQLYYDSYDPGIASSTPEEALEDITLTFEGGYGVLDPTLSRLAWQADRLVGALLVVERAPWPDTPDCPFVIELFTARSHRRQGIAKLLLSACSEATVALRVDPDNKPAVRLYGSFGFQEG